MWIGVKIFFRNISFVVFWAQKSSFYKASVVCTNYTYAALERKPLDRFPDFHLSHYKNNQLGQYRCRGGGRGVWKTTENKHLFRSSFHVQNIEFYFINKKRFWRLWSNLGQKYHLRLSTIWFKHNLSKYIVWIVYYV